MTTADTVPETEPGPPGEDDAAGQPPAGPRSTVAIETVVLLLSPLLVSLWLGGQRMVSVLMIDPTFYTAYAQHGPDLLERYGDDNYYWARQGFLLPARIAYLLFGAVPGFLVLRYAFALVAIVPAYVLLRRLHGRLAGGIGVAVILTSQVVLAAWGTDYPDSSAVAYLVTGTACLFMPARSPSGAPWWLPRLGWVLGAGFAMSLAVHSQTWSAPLVAALVFAYVVAYGSGAEVGAASPGGLERRSRWFEAVAHAVVVAGMFILVTAVLALCAKAFFGSSNIIRPTLSAGAHFRTPAELAKWHSTSWRWIINDPYLFVPPTVVGGWFLVVAARWRNGSRPPWSEVGIVLATASQGAAYLAGQFLGQVAVVEFFLYSSMLWPGVCLTTAFLFVRLSAAADGRRRDVVRATIVALILATPWALVPWTPGLEFDMTPDGLALVALMLVVLAVAAWWRKWYVGLVAIAVVLGCAEALVVGVPIHRPLEPGQVSLPSPPYGFVMLRNDQALIDRYAVISEIPTIVPAPDGVGNDDLLLWWSPNETLNFAAAEFLWHRNSLRETMPDLSDDSIVRLREREPEDVLMLSITGADFPAAIASLRTIAPDAEVVRTATFSQGDTVVHVQLVQMGLYGA